MATPESKVLKAAIARAKACGALPCRLSFRPGVAAGWPDLLILFRGGRVLFMECKRPGGKPTALQRYTMGRLREYGFAVTVCDSEDAARAAIMEAVGAVGVPAPRG